MPLTVPSNSFPSIPESGGVLGAAPWPRGFDVRFLMGVAAPLLGVGAWMIMVGLVVGSSNLRISYVPKATLRMKPDLTFQEWQRSKRIMPAVMVNVGAPMVVGGIVVLVMHALR